MFSLCVRLIAVACAPASAHLTPACLCSQPTFSLTQNLNSPKKQVPDW